MDLGCLYCSPFFGSKVTRVQSRLLVQEICGFGTENTISLRCPYHLVLLVYNGGNIQDIVHSFEVWGRDLRVEPHFRKLILGIKR